MAQHTEGQKWTNDNIQQDTCEWIEKLYYTILNLLGQNMRTNWYNMFNFQVTNTYECCTNSEHKSQNITSDIILQLPVRDDAGRAITSLNHSVDHLFKKTIIHKK